MSDVTIKIGSTRAILSFVQTYRVTEAIRMVTSKRLYDFTFDFNRRSKFKRPICVPNKKYLVYEPETKNLIIPVNAVDIIKEKLEEYHISYDIQPEALIEPRHITVQMKPDFKPRDAQIPVIDYLTSDFPYRKGLSTATGSGKTVSSIASIVKSGKVGMIVCSGLTEQWERAIFQFTTAKKEDVCLIKGFKSLFDLMNSDYMPSFIIWSLETLRLYVNRAENYAELPPYDKFLEYFGVGIKLMDEVHLNFHAETMIDLRSNVANNWYLTATFLSANASTRRIFNMIYPQDLQYNPNGRDKYVKVQIVQHHGLVPERYCVRQRGYNHAFYENFLIKKKLIDVYFQQWYRPCIESYYINYAAPGEKMFIYFARLEVIDRVVELLKETYPKYKVCKYVNGVPDSVLKENDIIVTTPKKASCGTDCPMLRTVINTVSMRAPALVEQIRGRLRKLKSGNQPIYVELVDVNLQAQLRHYNDRKIAHRIASADFEETMF